MLYENSYIAKCPVISVPSLEESVDAQSPRESDTMFASGAPKIRSFADCYPFPEGCPIYFRSGTHLEN